MNNKLLYIVGMAFLLSTTANGQQHAADSLGNNGLDAEMIDLGYIKKNRSNLTQAVSTVSSEVFENKTATILQNSLYGLFPGLYAKQDVGWHAEAALNVRGRGGLGDGTPLICRRFPPFVECDYAGRGGNDVCAERWCGDGIVWRTWCQRSHFAHYEKRCLQLF